MTANVINLEEERRVKERGRIVAKTNDYYRQLLERGWTVCVPEKKKWTSPVLAPKPLVLRALILDEEGNNSG